MQLSVKWQHVSNFPRVEPQQVGLKKDKAADSISDAKYERNSCLWTPNGTTNIFVKERSTPFKGLQKYPLEETTQMQQNEVPFRKLRMSKINYSGKKLLYNKPLINKENHLFQLYYPYTSCQFPCNIGTSIRKHCHLEVDLKLTVTTKQKLQASKKKEGETFCILLILLNSRFPGITRTLVEQKIWMLKCFCSVSFLPWLCKFHSSSK